MWFKLNAKKRRSSAGECSRTRFTDDNGAVASPPAGPSSAAFPSSTSPSFPSSSSPLHPSPHPSSPQTAFSLPPQSSEPHTHTHTHTPAHILKTQRSQFLRLFGRRPLTPKSSNDSLSSVETSFSASTSTAHTTTDPRRRVKSVSSRSSISSSDEEGRRDTEGARVSSESFRKGGEKGKGKQKSRSGKASPTSATTPSTTTKTKERKDPFTPTLPPELWTHILHLAAEPAHPFLSSSYLSSSSSPSLSPSHSSSPPNSSYTPQTAPPVSFLTHPSSPSSPHLFAAHAQSMSFKLSLTTVCKLWHALAQEVLWEFVWVRSGRHAEAVLRVLDGRALRGSGSSEEVGARLGLGENAGTLALASVAKAKVAKGAQGNTQTFAYDTRDLGRYIRRLHIETRSSLDRCDPGVIRRIVRHARGVQVFGDVRGMRRGAGFWVGGPERSLVLGGKGGEAGMVLDVGGGGGGGREEEEREEIRQEGRVRAYTYTSTSTTSVTTSSSSLFDADDCASASTMLTSPSSSCSPISPSSSSSSSSTSPSPPSTSTSPSPHVYSAETYLDDRDTVVLSALLSPTSPTSLRRLSWTSYNHPVPSRPSSSSVVSLLAPQGQGHAYGFSSQGAFGAPGTHSTDGGAFQMTNKKPKTRAEKDFEEGVRYFSMVVAPKIGIAAERLEFLELTLCGGDVFRQGEDGGWLSSMLSAHGSSRCARGRIGDGIGIGMNGQKEEERVERVEMPEPLHLPVLRSLKVTLDNATFHVLSTWSTPSLTHLSVISADFSYAGAGFREFFEAHGAGLTQLELGHSTEAIEDYFLSASEGAHEGAIGGGGGGGVFGYPGLGPHHTHPTALDTGGNGDQESEGTTSGWRYTGMRVPLADWCPNLEQFICSAEAEWNWTHPDWIAPHVLLPAHPGLEFIGVRGLERRVREGLERCVNLDRAWAARRVEVERRERGGGVGVGAVGGGGKGIGREGLYPIEVRGRDGKEVRVEGDEAFFMLTEQFGSLFNREAFPALKYVRDLSWESGVMRSGPGGVGPRFGGGFGGGGGFGKNASVVGGGGGERGHQGNMRHPMGAVKGFLRDMLRPGHHQSSPYSSSSSSSAHTGTVLSTKEAEIQKRFALQQHRRVLRFWMRVLEKCKERGVYLEDWEGWSVTVGEMRRVALGGVEGV